MPTLALTKTFDVNLTPKDLAAYFATMTEKDQAIFFNSLAEEVDTWPGGCSAFSMQLQSVVDTRELSPAAKQIVAKIGQYGQFVKTEEPVVDLDQVAEDDTWTKIEQAVEHKK